MQTPYRIIVIEDDDQALEILRETLAGLGPALVLAEEASEGVARSLEEPPSLLLINLAARGTGGLDVCKKIHGNENTQDVPIILLTLREGKFDPVYTRLYGIVGFISKPLTRDTLLMGLSSHVPPEIISGLERGSAPLDTDSGRVELSGQDVESLDGDEGAYEVPPGEEEEVSWNLDESSFGQPVEKLAQEALQSETESETESVADAGNLGIETTGLEELSDTQADFAALEEELLETHRVQETAEVQISAWEGREEDSHTDRGLESYRADETLSGSITSEETTLDEAAIERAIEESPEPQSGEHIEEEPERGPYQVAKTFGEDSEQSAGNDQPVMRPADDEISFDESVLSGIGGGSLDSDAASSAMGTDMGPDRMEAAMAAARTRRYQSKRPRYRPRRKKQSGSRALLLLVLLLVVTVAAAGSYLLLSGHAGDLPWRLPWKLPWAADHSSPPHPSPVEDVSASPDTLQPIEAPTPEPVASQFPVERTEPEMQTSESSSAPMPVAEDEDSASTSDPEPPVLATSPLKRGGHFIQFGMFGSERNAHRLVRDLKEAGYNATVRRDRFRSGKIAYRVVLNRAFESSREAENKARALQRESGRKTYVYSE